jgi:hypothetical protein
MRHSNSEGTGLALPMPPDSAHARCLEAIADLGWDLRQDMSGPDQIVCYVPLPDLLPRAPVYFLSLYETSPEQTHIVLTAASDDLSQSRAQKDLARLRSTIIRETTEADPELHKQPTATPSDTRAIFLSYRRFDSADVTGRMYDRLVQHFGSDKIFKDVDSIPLGSDFRKVLDGAVSQCAVLLAVIGRDWLHDSLDDPSPRLHDPADWVRIEIESALRRDIPVIPVLVRGARFPAEQDLPDSLRDLVYRNGIEVRPDPDFHRDMDRLIQHLDDLLSTHG